MLTKQDLTAALKTTEERLTAKIEASRKEFKTEIEASRKEFNEEIETAVIQISSAIVKAFDEVATKDDLLEIKRELKTEIMYIKSDVRDLKADSPTSREFADHEKRITALEETAFPS